MHIDFKTKKEYQQTNNLIKILYSQEFTVLEIKLFEIAMNYITIEDIEKTNNKKYIMSATQLSNLLNTSLSFISHYIEKTLVRIMKKNICIESEVINIIPFAQYKKGILEFNLNYRVIPYVIEINKNFNRYQLNYILSMTSSYAIKLYKLLYQYRNIKKIMFTVIQLKEHLGICDKYFQYSSFKKRILMTSINQINELTDLYISFDEIKISRRVDTLEFYFKMQDKPKKIPFVMNKPEIVIENQQINELINDIEVELSTKTKEQKLQKQQDLKLFLEDMWQNLNVEDQINYINQSNELIKKYNQLTNFFNDIEKKLPISLFAIFNGKSYDKMIEIYCKNILNIF